MNPLSLVRDAGLAAGLVAALGIVFLVDRWQGPSPSSGLGGGDGSKPRVQEPARAWRLAVSHEDQPFDDMGQLLTNLGEVYKKYERLSLNDLLDPRKIAETNVLFVACSGSPESWLGDRVRAGERANTEIRTVKLDVLDHAKENLRKFVSRGGTLYASDLHFNLIAYSFPEFVDRGKVNEGKTQDVDAEVVDPDLREQIGARVPLKFDQPGWRPAAFKGEKVTVYMRGSYDTQEGKRETAPLLVRFPLKDGNVIFTSFHNEKQPGETEKKLLKFLVFTAMTANVQSRTEEIMGGFSKSRGSLISVSKGDASLTRTYQCDKSADLRFVLGFENRGARLKLTVIAPDGTTAGEQEGDSTFTIDVPKAAPGEWKYTVTAISVPTENFPFRVTVGEK